MQVNLCSVVLKIIVLIIQVKDNTKYVGISLNPDTAAPIHACVV